MKNIAIICDCDNTLMPDLPSLLLKDNEIEPQDFWDDIDLLVRDGWDPPIAWMTKLIKLIQDEKIKQNTNEKLAEFSASVDVYPGSDTFINEINSKLGTDSDVSVEGYVVSSGIESMMKGSKIANSFTDIFGGRLYEKDGIIAGIKSSITFTEKTKFIFAINKGITSKIREKPYDVNNFISEG